MRLLLISNSTNPGEPYLDYPKTEIKSFLGKVKEVVFIPYAAVTFSYDDYVHKVQERFDELGIKVKGIHSASDAAKEIREAEAIVVGGGNTFHLLRELQKSGIAPIIAERVGAGIPYIGWSAGSNLACPGIYTTNDMPIVEPESFKAFNFIPFQINPHYLDAHPEGHAGETREQRIKEFLKANPEVYVAGLRESCMLKLEDQNLQLIGSKPIRIFRYNNTPLELKPGVDLSFLLK